MIFMCWGESIFARLCLFGVVVFRPSQKSDHPFAKNVKFCSDDMWNCPALIGIAGKRVRYDRARKINLITSGVQYQPHHLKAHADEWMTLTQIYQHSIRNEWTTPIHTRSSWRGTNESLKTPTFNQWMDWKTEVPFVKNLGLSKRTVCTYILAVSDDQHAGATTSSKREVP